MGTNIGTAGATGAVTNSILWMYDENAEHAHRIEFEANAIAKGNADNSASKTTGVTHNMTQNSQSASYNVALIATMDAANTVASAANTTHGQRMFVDTFSNGALSATNGASTTMGSWGWTNMGTTNTS